MKIYILPLADCLLPETQEFIWPPDSNDFGVEQDFRLWLEASDLVTDDPDEADWHAMLLYWNRWFWTHEEDRSGKGEFNDSIQAAILDREKTFTVAEYGPLLEQPDVNLEGVTIFTASRRGDTRGIDIPLLLHPHAHRPIKSRRQWLASFAGNYETDGTRMDTYDALKDHPGVHFSPDFLGIHQFVELLQDSYVSLAPRGRGIASYRFYEAMQVGTVPLLISDIDGRPFKQWIDWDSCSYYRKDAEGLSDWLGSIPLQEMVEKGMLAQQVYYEQLRYGQWCKYVIKTLEGLG
jgi:hypothetical protein